MASSGSFAIPLAFPGHSDTRHNLGEQLGPTIVGTSCSRAQPTALASWHVPGTQTGGEQAPSPFGTVFGCVDGSLFVFKQAGGSYAPVTPKNSEIRHVSRPTSPLHVLRGSQSTSRSVSPSSTAHPPFAVSSRSRIVSGITAEQVEAPKNYVDFDDEPDKLKDLLQGRKSKERPPSTSALPSSERATNLAKGLASSALDSSQGGLKRKDDAKSLLSATNSPSFTPRSLSGPSSPNVQTTFNRDTDDLRLLYHVIPPRSGPGHAVSALRLLNHDHLMTVLQESGELSILDVKDGRCATTVHVDVFTLPPPEGMKEKASAHLHWTWSHLETFNIAESQIILVAATVGADSPSSGVMEGQEDGAPEQSRLAIFEFHPADEVGAAEVKLEPLGQWHFDGPADSVGVFGDSDNAVTFFNVTSEQHFMARKLRLLPRTVIQQAELPVQEHHMKNLAALPNPFKAMKPGSGEHIALPEVKEVVSRIALEEEHDLGILPSSSLWLKFRTQSFGDRLLGVGWSEQELVAFETKDNTLRVLFVTPIADIEDVKWVGDATYAIAFSDRTEVYELKTVNADNEEVASESPSFSDLSLNVQPRLRRTITTGAYQGCSVLSSTELLTTTVDADGRRHLTRYSCDEDSSASADVQRSHSLWRASTPTRSEAYPGTHLTSVLPLELDVIILGYADGLLRQSSLSRMCHKSTGTPHYDKISAPALDGYIVGLHLVQNGRTKEHFVVGGADDGSIAFWNADTLKLCARWTIFIAPLARVVQFLDSQSGPLRGCVLCVSQDGTIAVIAVDGFQFLYLIPGASSPLLRVCLGEDNLLLFYANHRARLWDVKTKEFWRSMTIEKAEEILHQGGWTDISLESRPCLPNTVLKSLPSTSHSRDTASTLVLDLERFITESTAVAKSMSTSRNQTRDIFMARDRLRSILSTLLTLGLNEDIDEICQETLGIPLGSTFFGHSSRGFTSLYTGQHPYDPWCISPDVSASRALSIIVTLRALSLFEELSEGATTVIAFYATSLSLVGPLYQAPSLAFLAQRWFDSSNELRHAARTLFDAVVVRLSDEETNDTIERWQHHLPCLQPTADRESLSAALSLFICGYIGAEKYSLLSTSALTDITKSISLYLHDDQSPYRVLAVDLCSRGFHIWQHYIDAMEVLRALFALATSSRKEGLTAQNTGAQARLSVLHIASSNTALFMTTLGLDILHPTSMEHRKSVMQIVAFLIRKRPMVLYPNLPKLMEAVVQSLDPNSTSSRDAVLDTATEILGYVVKMFPSVDFHMATQRLAVGTSEGAIVMYDLKTAIRLYVLEGHKKRITACSFSPDGRRLVTLSLEESVVLVWKVGSSFSSFFNPGAPPRQGHAGSEPFKTLSFNVGDDASMNVAGTLDLVRFDWTADRSVKLRIRESILTFST